MALNRLLVNGLSQRSYIDTVLDRFSMKDSKPGDTLVAKGDKFCIKQCLTMDLEKEWMHKVPYASVVGSLMYAQVCTRSDLAFVVGVLGRYLSNPGMQHWIAVKHVMRYLKRTKNFVLTYRKSDNLEIIGYSGSDFSGCLDSIHSTFGYIFLLVGRTVSWKSSKQTLVAPSTMTIDLEACFEASNHAI
ncbi:secreted RxLR effector protein 161-like [Lathyrus oleraceus]|uniref:secreted RxLR effector protein 161-like n=1 Tax=Pisum sativum TaxID=3888 RepID=UPI0021D0A951|nr:secreted RxLR effector protein 161-like [Pisum sativum]